MIRIVEGVSGRVRVRSELAIRFDYGSVIPWVRRREDGTIAIAGPDALLVTAPVDLVGENMHTVSEFELSPGERVPFVLTWFPSNQELPERVDAERGARRHRGLLARVDGSLRARGTAPRRARPLARHAEGAHVRADGRDRRGADDVAPRGARRGPQLGLPLLLGARRDADAALARARGLRGRGGRVARLAAPRDRRLARRAAVAVRDRGRAAERRGRAAVARGVRGLEAGAGRERGRRPAPARRLRRDPRRALPGAMRGPAAVGRRVGAQPASARAARDGLARARRGDLGGARPAAALHALEGDVLGGVRPRRAVRRGARSRGSRRALAGAAGRGARRRVPERVPRGGRRVHAVLRLGSARREPAADAARRLPAGRRSACRRARSPRSSASSRTTGSCSATAPTTRTSTSTASHPAREPSSPARSGSSRCWRSRADGTRPRRSSSRCSTLRNDLGLLAEEYDPVAKRLVGNFPQAFTHFTLVDAALTLAGSEGRLPAGCAQRCPKWWARGSAVTTSGLAATRRASGERLSSSRTRTFRFRSTRS